MNNKFINLINKSTYSFLQGYGLPETIVKRAKELNQTAIGICDYENISSHFKFYKSCIENEIKPILGCTVTIVDNVEEKNAKHYQINLIAKNIEGYENLIRIVSFSWNEGFYYVPRADWSILKKYGKGLIATSGGIKSKICVDVLTGMRDDEQIIKDLQEQKSWFDEYYVEMQPYGDRNSVILFDKMFELSEKSGIETLMINDAHYPNKDDYEIRDAMFCIKKNVKFDDLSRFRFENENCYLKTYEEIKEEWNKNHPKLNCEQAIQNTVKVAEKIYFKFPEAKPIYFPLNQSNNFNLSKIYTDKKELIRDICEEGIKFRGWTKETFPKEYKERMEFELDLMGKKDFIDYFLVIADLIRFAKNNGIIIGPGRGSAAGSLICYLTRITDVDPLKYGLMFERFIDINRFDLPDVDIDIQDDRREEVKKYLEDKYGIDRVATLSTFMQFKGKLCIQDIVRIFNLPYKEIEPLKKLVLDRSGGDSRASLTVMDTFDHFEKAREIVEKYPQLKYAIKLESQLRQIGVHAAGVVVSNEDIEKFAAIYKVRGRQIISLGGKDAEQVGLLKIDLLGLNTLTALDRMIKLVKERHGKEIDVLKIDLEDKKVIKQFADGKLFGIFQFEGTAMMQVCRQLKPDFFEELSAVNALSRPGPLHSQSTQHYLNRKFGREEITYPHPLMESLTKDTYGIVIYQEQVMKTMREVGSMSWEDTSQIRKLISKSQGVEKFNTFKEKFATGARKNGLKDEEINNIWDSICTFGSWAFNKAHSVSYSILGFWMMYFKFYYPLEFYGAMCQISNKEEKIKRILKEYQSDGCELLPINANKSKENFIIDGKGIRVGFKQIKGLGNRSAELLVQKQPYTSYQDFCTKNKGKKVQELLEAVGAFKELPYGEKTGQISLFSGYESDEKNEFNKEATIEDLAKYCPVLINDKVYEHWKEWCDEYLVGEISQIKELEHVVGKKVFGIIGHTNPTDYNLKNVAEERISRGGEFEMEKGKVQQDYDFMNFDLEDETDFVTVRIPPQDYNKNSFGYKHYKSWIWDISPKDVLLAVGMVTEGRRMLFSSAVVNLSSLKNKLEKGLELTNIEKTIIK